jgi:hypothetical protein
MMMGYADGFGMGFVMDEWMDEGHRKLLYC